MSEIIGAFRPPCEQAEIESLTLRFSPNSIPIKQRWRNNGLSADFLADYVSTFFPRVEDDPASETRRIEISGAVKYIANELLENGMKYSVECSADGENSGNSPPMPISIMLQLDHEQIAFWETNTISAEQCSRFRAFIDRLQVADANELYLEQLERSAEGETSGLGFLTMKNDYSAHLAWKFEELVPNTVTVTTHVYLAI